MSTFVQTDSGDLDVSTGNLVVEQRPEWCVVYELRGRFRLYRGSWWLDQRIGIPYYESILGRKNPNLRLIEQLFRRVIETCPGVKSLDDIALTFDSAARTAVYSFRCTTDTGAVIVGGSGTPFIVQEKASV